MPAVEPAASGDLLSERVAGGILPKVLNSFDMVAILVAIVLSITDAAVIQSAGPTAFGWLISNNAGTVSVFGAKISHGSWSWWVGGIALASMAVGPLLHLLGRRTAASLALTGAVPAAGPGT